MVLAWHWSEERFLRKYYTVSTRGRTLRLTHLGSNSGSRTQKQPSTKEKISNVNFFFFLHH